MSNADQRLQQAAAARTLSGQAWDDFCQTLQQAGRMIEQLGDVPTELDRAEWYRFLSRTARGGFERFVENCEPNRPRFRNTGWRQSINFQCPDQDHFLCEFDEAVDYRIRGNLGTVPYFVLAVWSAKQPRDLGARDWAEQGAAGLEEFDPATLRTTAFLPSEAIECDAQGNFEIIVSQREHAGNWLKLDPDSVGMLVRVVYEDRTREHMPPLEIERLDGAPPRPLRPEELSRGLAKAGQMVLGYAELVRSWWQSDLSQRPNQLRFSQATYLSNGGVADRHHAFGSWHKSPEEALVIEFTPPKCEYWIFQLCNLWQENLDNYEDGQGYVSKYTVCAEADGKVRVVIAERDPAIGGNWLDPYGHIHGGMSLRLIKAAIPPEVSVWRLPLAMLQARGWTALEETQAIDSDITA